jgi:hypothetical protein
MGQPENSCSSSPGTNDGGHPAQNTAMRVCVQCGPRPVWQVLCLREGGLPPLRPLGELALQWPAWT